MPLDPRIRPLSDDDALDVIELISGIFGEYAGVIADVDGEMPELRQLASHYARAGGRGWVAEQACPPRRRWIVGTVGVIAGARPGVVELKKLYVHREARGTTLADALVGEVEQAARALGAHTIELWSDVKFTRAHRFYARHGFVRGATRALSDKSDTVEFHFERSLADAPAPEERER